MSRARVLLSVALVASALVSGCDHPPDNRATGAKAAPEKKPAGPAPVEKTPSAERTAAGKNDLPIFIANGFKVKGDPSSLFVLVHNDTEDRPLTDVTVTALVFLGPDNLMLPDLMFAKQIDAIKKGDLVNIPAAELTNDRGQRLSESKVKVTHVWVLGKVGGVPRGTVRKIGVPEE